MEQQSLMKAWKLLQLLWRSWGILLLLGLKRHTQLSFPGMTQESLWKYSCNSWRPRKTWDKASEEVCPCLQPGHSWTVVQAGQFFPFPSWFIYPEWQAVRRLYLGWPHNNWNNLISFPTARINQVLFPPWKERRADSLCVLNHKVHANCKGQVALFLSFVQQWLHSGDFQWAQCTHLQRIMHMDQDSTASSITESQSAGQT